LNTPKDQWPQPLGNCASEPATNETTLAAAESTTIKPCQGKKKRRINLTSRQMQVLKLRKRGYTQEKVAKILGTSRENVSIIERNAYKVVWAAQATIQAFESLHEDGVLLVPSRTSIYDIPRLIFLRGDVLGIRVKTDENEIIALVKSKRKLRDYRLMSPLAVKIKSNGQLLLQ
jgi:Tfx family DNA-binding protein